MVDKNVSSLGAEAVGAERNGMRSISSGETWHWMQFWSQGWVVLRPGRAIKP